MRSSTISFAAVLLVATAAVAQSPRSSDDIVLLASADAKGVVTDDQLDRCLLLVAEQWKINRSQLPRIVVFHVSERVARQMSLSKVTLRRTHGVKGQDSYYEVWIADEPNSHGIALAFENIVENSFQLHVTEEQRGEVVARVSRAQDDVVSAYVKRSRK